MGRVVDQRDAVVSKAKVAAVPQRPSYGRAGRTVWRRGIAGDIGATNRRRLAVSRPLAPRGCPAYPTHIYSLKNAPACSSKREPCTLQPPALAVVQGLRVGGRLSLSL